MDCVMTTTTTAAQEPWATMRAAQTTATSLASVQQGIQYMIDELRAGKMPPKAGSKQHPHQAEGRRTCIKIPQA
jgi:hypothetical protein